MQKATDKIRYYQNENGPVIGVTVKPVIRCGDLTFKDHTGDGLLTAWKDWRNSPSERAAALANELSIDEKIGLLFVNAKKMGLLQEDKTKVDETGLLDEEIVEQDESIFNVEKSYGTTHTIKEMGIRHLIFRQNPQAADMADWINQLNEIAEETEHGIPMVITSNSRNENGEVVFGMNDAAGIFPAWPGTMGIAAAVKGNGPELVDTFAEYVRQEWDAVGLKKGYMYMADAMTDPRWQRTYGTFGEDPELITEMISRLVPGIQGSDDGVTPEGVAVTIKHFPGGGARENGFDPHYVQGQWNVYQTEGSLGDYHLPAFQAAVAKKASSIMPYYAKPAAQKSLPQYDLNGKPVPMTPVGFAFNRFFIQDLLRDQMGFTGYVNSDSGITNKMAWGVEELDGPSRVALAVNTGVDIISGSLDVDAAREAWNRWKHGYYTTQGHPVPEGYTAEQLTLSEEAITRAVVRTLEEEFALGLFENPYRDPAQADRVIADKAHWDAAADVHRKSVVLLKDKGALPLSPDRTEGKKVYAECFRKDGGAAAEQTQSLREALAQSRGLLLTDRCEEADFALLFISPSSGEYFHATSGYLELDICEDKQVTDVDDLGRPAATFHLETTLTGAPRIREIARAVHGNGGKVISCVNFTLAWMLGNVEPYSDGLLAGFDTCTDALLDMILGKCRPTGRLPITLPKNDAVLAVDKDGVCVSHNDVPGFAKDRYMPDSLKDENGKAYAYRDEMGNYYELNFGL